MSKSRGQRALGRIKDFMSQNCKHWKQDVGYIEEELKDYSEIKEIAKHYHFDNLARDTHMTTTDEKYLRLFNAAIPDIQADYRKARAFEIIKKKSWLNLDDIRNASDYDTYLNRKFKPGDIERRFLEEGENMDWLATREEFYYLKEALK